MDRVPGRRAVLKRLALAASCAPAAAGFTILPFAGSRSTRAAAREAFSVKVLLDEPLGVIEPEVYGHFAEHIGGVIYDGIWVGRDSRIPNIEGMRRSLIEHVRRLGRTVLRWPGGCYADRYHWRDGIGPPKDRPRRFGRWREVTESNAFGTHEFLRFCELCGAEPYLAANVGTGTAEEFQQWMEYVNAPSGATTLADERAANGRREPWRVRFWGVGNESWGCGGNFTPEDYCTEYRKFATWVPEYGVPVFLIASGPSSNDLDWTRRFLKKWADSSRTPLHGWSPHYYCGTTGHALDFTVDQWYEMLEKASRMEVLIRDQWGALGEFDKEHRAKLIIDEWGTWHPEGTEINKDHLFEQMGCLRDALVAALTLDIFNRHPDKVRMANIAQLVNNLQSLFLADGDRFVATPNFHVFEMYQPHQGAQSVRIEVEAERIPFGAASRAEAGKPAVRGEVFRLAGSASLKERDLTLTLVHAHASEPAEAALDIGKGQASGLRHTILTHASLNAHNTFDAPNEVIPKPVPSTGTGRLIRVTLPPASVSRLDIRLA